MPPAAKNGMADAMPFFEAVKKDSFLTKDLRPDCSARAVRLRRTARTFAGREVFSSPHMSPKKMIGLSLRLRAQTLRGFYIICSPQTRQCTGAAGNAVEGIDRRQMRLERAHELAPEQTAERVEHQIVHITQTV